MKSTMNTHTQSKHGIEYRVVEKHDPLACHGIFDSQRSAEKHLRDVIPVYVKRGFFMDKTLTADDFKVIQYPIVQP